MSAFDYDLVVIGAGSGGVRAARVAASHGAKVAIAEEFRVGGTCVIRGCVPKKLYVMASRFRDDIEDARGFGWRVGETRFDWARSSPPRRRRSPASPAFTSRRWTMRSRAHPRARHRRRPQRRAFLGRAHGDHALSSSSPPAARQCSRRMFRASNGAFRRMRFSTCRPSRSDCSSSARAISPSNSPASSRGSGRRPISPIAPICRCAASTTICASALAEALTGAGVIHHAGALPTRIDKSARGFTAAMSDGETREVDAVLIATGRRPMTQNLGLERAGVATRENGAIIVDAQSCTNVPSIFAVGDVTDRINLTPVAIREGHAFADSVFGSQPTTVNYDCVASAVFTTPEVGTVGLTEAEAMQSFPALDIYETSFRPMRATLSGRAERVYMKLVVDGESQRVLGAHIFGPEAGEMAQLVAIPMRMGATKQDFDATMAVHPTAAEELVTMRSPARQHRREA